VQRAGSSSPLAHTEGLRSLSQQLTEERIMRSSLIIGSVLLVAMAGCNKAADEKAKADQAQINANDKIAEANRDADQKINEAQADADKKTAEAQANFLKMREDYRHDVTEKLVDLDHKIADLEAKSRTATGKTKTDLDARLKQIHAERDAFVNEYKGIELASASTWDSTKARLDKSWDELKKLVDRA
jgi:cell division septum initiation protein DivIVA